MMIRRTTKTRHKRELDASIATVADPMPSHAVCDLVEYLEEGLAVTGCDHSFRCSETFLLASNFTPQPILQWLARYGARCDCEVLEEFEQRRQSPSFDAG